MWLSMSRLTPATVAATAADVSCEIVRLDASGDGADCAIFGDECENLR